MSELSRDLGVVTEHARAAPENVVALLEADTDGQFACALVALVSFAARKEVSAVPGKVEDDRHHVACQSLQLASIVLRPATSGSPSAAAATCLFAATLLKAQTLHAAARQVAAVNALLAPGAGGQPSHGGNVLRMRAGDLACLHLCLAGTLAMISKAQHDTALAGSLLAALEESSLLGHASRLILLMRPAAPGPPPAPQLSAKQAELLIAFGDALSPLTEHVPRGDPRIAEEASIGAAIGPYCRRALLVLYGSFLAAADGQPCGLPIDPLLSSPVSQATWYPCLRTSLLSSCLPAFGLDAASPAPSLSPRAILRLALRALVLAGASARAGAGAVSLDAGRQLVVDLSWAGGRRRGMQAFRVLLTPGEVGNISRSTLLPLYAATERWPRAWDAEAARAWAPLLTAALHCLATAAGEDGQIPDWVDAPSTLLCAALRRLQSDEGSRPALFFDPAALPPSVAAVLEGGVVPLLETMLRCAAGSPAGPEARLVGRIVTAPGSSFAALVAHSPPRQAASLLRTLAKLLRTLPPDILLRPARPQATEELESVVIRTALNIVELTLRTCSRARQPVAGGDLDPAAPCAPVCVLALAVLQLLPELSRLTLGAAQLVPSSQRSLLAERKLLDLCVGLVLCASSLAANYTKAGAAGFLLHRLGSALCLPLLVEECGAVPLLGALLEVSLGGGEAGQQILSSTAADALAGFCLSVYAHYPRLVRGRGSGADGAGGSTAPGAAAAWSPEALRLLATRVSDTERVEGQQLEDLADRLEQPDSHPPAKVARSRASALAAAAQRLAALRAEAAALLPACANPACASLEGDSAAEVRLQQCGRCRRVSYCCRDCQTAHWKAGHKAECGVESS
ncbi:hypothetical protein HYH03_004479 [Edaphochlamys debaryana]|uniref:phytol kinase n=1 Tax=Edaphochlamys debaryana TaxID=47281 RepID=A0A835Y816_9CHLO|nr:hypothetical protein HYH03_004479 [Edaphochlamys debaryana]|eukprot:KAG2497746.1 hypothetical protein HYH03_004479 [Edaphochlamys debaryana]